MRSDARRPLRIATWLLAAGVALASLALADSRAWSSTVSLTTGVVGNGSVSRSPDLLPYDTGAVMELTATPSPGWVFVGWGGDASGSDNPLAILMNADKTVQAMFAYEIDLDLRPRSLRLGSSRHWLKGTLRFPSGVAGSVSASSIRLNGVVPVAPGAPVRISGTRLEAVFSRAAVEATVVVGDRVPITVTGLVCGENGCTVDEFGNVIGADAFAGVDYIRVMPTRIHRPCDGDLLLAGSTFNIRWDADPDGSAVALWSSLDDGATWRMEVQALPNTGVYRWAVPGTTATRARLRIVTSYGPDEDGDVDEPEILGSDAFAITATTAVEAEAAVFGLTPTSPIMGSFVVGFSLASSAPASLAVFDVSGRRVVSREVGSSGPGRHTLKLGELPAGIYVVRLSQGGRSLSSRVPVLR